MSESQHQVNEQSIRSINPENSADALNLKLNPDPLLARIEQYLWAARIEEYQDPVDNTIKTRVLSFGKAKAYPEGVQSILQWVSSLVNPHTVQGNFVSNQNGYSEHYQIYLRSLRIQLGNHLWINLVKYGIDEVEYQGIVDVIMLMLEPYFTRLIDNQERVLNSKSSVETERSVYRSKGVPLFDKPQK